MFIPRVKPRFTKLYKVSFSIKVINQTCIFNMNKVYTFSRLEGSQFISEWHLIWEHEAPEDKPARITWRSRQDLSLAKETLRKSKEIVSILVTRWTSAVKKPKYYCSL